MGPKSWQKFSRGKSRLAQGAVLISMIAEFWDQDFLRKSWDMSRKRIKLRFPRLSSSPRLSLVIFLSNIGGKVEESLGCPWYYSILHLNIEVFWVLNPYQGHFIYRSGFLSRLRSTTSIHLTHDCPEVAFALQSSRPRFLSQPTISFSKS